jgi:hypothetical protein
MRDPTARCPRRELLTTERFRGRNSAHRNQAIITGMPEFTMRPLTAALISALCFQAVAVAQQLPPVYFNHLPLFVSQATIDDLESSSFLNTELCYFRKQTTQRDGGKWSYTGIYLFGRGTYLEFVPGSDHPGPGAAPAGSVGIGMWIDDRPRLSQIRDSLARFTPGTPGIHVQKDARNLNWFDLTAADYPDEESATADSFVMAIYGGEDLKRRVPDLTPEEDGTDRDHVYHRRFNPTLLLNRIVGLTLTVNANERDHLTQEFKAYGYSISENRGETIASGPEFILTLVPAMEGQSRHMAIKMSLNHFKAGSQVVAIGKTSAIRFNGDSAVWYFPADWRR